MSMFAVFLLLSYASLHFLYYMTTITTTSSSSPQSFPPLLALALLGLSLALFVHIRRRRRRGGADKDARSDSLRFFPPDTTASDGRKLSATSSAAPAPAAPAGSEFLYLGTLVNSRGHANESSAAQPAAGGGSPYRKLGSPELRPLPPLPRQFQNAEGGRSSSEEFYSPKNSPGGKGSSAAGPASSSKKPALGSKMESRRPPLHHRRHLGLHLSCGRPHHRLRREDQCRIPRHLHHRKPTATESRQLCNLLVRTCSHREK
ncbi:hypothetical protein OPV22_027511 [Ensete ventricosum]|uniref:Uncharacterized protein n=1 Tax=Ensete ventricosum TaxID=4639 RepID=A0AAV8Q0S8_ENSVE|nr:hypothetical protein OPV22_027511 [Ensete ventricosum]